MTFGPSRTSQAVALTRAELDRPHSPDGDPDAQRALCAGIEFTPPAWLRPGIEARTRFMDDHVTAALAAQVRQVVICGAGLDDRALRFRTPGVSFFEVDHPVTQADKATRLHAMGADRAGPRLVSCDFQADAIGLALAAAGHSGYDPTLFLCEGLLVYLDQDACHRLLAGMAACVAALVETRVEQRVEQWPLLRREPHVRARHRGELLLRAVPRALQRHHLGKCAQRAYGNGRQQLVSVGVTPVTPNFHEARSERGGSRWASPAGLVVGLGRNVPRRSVSARPRRSATSAACGY
jgi:O-methyltransferase involved in polyketide biosynthesis